MRNWKECLKEWVVVCLTVAVKGVSKILGMDRVRVVTSGVAGIIRLRTAVLD
jgi:hypothetical protein